MALTDPGFSTAHFTEEETEAQSDDAAKHVAGRWGE